MTSSTLHKAWCDTLSDDSVVNYCSTLRIEWKFIIALAPWQGGLYERLIGLTKSALRKAIGRSFLQFEELLTYLCETEAIINSRPLTYIHADITSPFFIRPIDFLLPRGLIGTNILEEEPNDPEYLPTLDSSGKLLRYWRTSQRFLDIFWKFWITDCLPSLQERYGKHKHPRFHIARKPEINEIVLIHEENIPRGSWKLGRITKLIQSSNDEHIRSAELVLPNRNKIQRPINLLFPLEIKRDDQDKDNENGNISDPETASDNNISKNDSDSEENSTTIPISTNRSIPSHGYNLRPRNNAINYALTFIQSTFFLFLITTNSSNGKAFSAPVTSCPDNSTQSNIIDSQNCVNKGIVVKRLLSGALCWTQVTCPHNQHLRSDGKCGVSCPCPHWATFCSYNTETKIIGNYTEDILEDEQPSVCSFEPDEKCKEKPSYEYFNQIQLYNGKKYFVRNLNIKIAETNPSQYDCIGSGSQTGSPEFCKIHDCVENGKKFCYYKKNDVTYFIGSDGKIPIKAWGSVKVTFYGEKSALTSSSSCQLCRVKCAQGGVDLDLDEDISLISVCTNPYCYQISLPKTQEKVMFPPEVNLHDHEVTVKIWSNGIRIKTIGVNCKSEPFCENIPCYFCLIRILNPQCAPSTILIILFILIYFSSITLLVFMFLLKYVGKCLYYFSFTCFHCSHYFINFFRKKQPTDSPIQQPTDSTSPVETRKHSHRPRLSPHYSTAIFFLFTLPIFFLLPEKTNACSAATTLTAKREICTTNNNEEICTINDITRVALVPKGQTTCLMLKDPQGIPGGSLKLKVHKISLNCQPNNQYFTRSFKMKSVATKRCANAGSCSDNKCKQYNKDSKIDELKGESDTHPGFTYCRDSCGCLACSCFYCTAACLFYRTYAVPTSDTVFEVFNCPVWPFSVKVTIILDLQLATRPSQKVLTLQPGIETKWRNFRLSLISISSPPVPFLGSSFLTDGEKTVMVRASASGQPVSGTIGEIQCSNAEKAAAFDCYLPHDMCTCVPQSDTISCTCPERSLETMFNKKEFLLPLQTQGFTVSGKGKHLTADYSNVASLEAQLSIKNFHLVLRHDKSSCRILPLSFSGCYSCITGAKLEYICKTDQGEALAHVSCGEGSFSTRCSPDGKKTTTTMTFSKSNINEKCSVTCSAGSTTFDLNTTLVFIDKPRLGEIKNIIADVKSGKGDIDFNAIADFFKNKWLSIIFIIILVIIFVILTIYCAPSLLIVSNTFFNSLKSKLSKSPKTSKQNKKISFVVSRKKRA